MFTFEADARGRFKKGRTMAKVHADRAPLADVQTVGIPRALLYYRYGTFWKAFFESLGRDVVVSDVSNQAIFEAGQEASVDETCLVAKLYLGHVCNLLDRDPAPDAIYVPGIANEGRWHTYCTKFQALPDVVRNGLYERHPRIISTYVEEQTSGVTAERVYRDFALQFGASKDQAKSSWKTALKAQRNRDAKLATAQAELIAAQKKLPKGDRPLTILLAAHPYVLHDPFVGGPVVDALRAMGVTVLFSDEFDHQRAYKRSYDFSGSMPWVVNREIVGSVLELFDQVDGIVLMSAYPCGPDSMTDDAISRRIQGKPMLMLTIDAQSGTAGIETRIESFVDILTYQKRGGYLHG